MTPSVQTQSTHLSLSAKSTFKATLSRGSLVSLVLGFVPSRHPHRLSDGPRTARVVAARCTALLDAEGPRAGHRKGQGGHVPRGSPEANRSRAGEPRPTGTKNGTDEDVCQQGRTEQQGSWFSFRIGV